MPLPHDLSGHLQKARCVKEDWLMLDSVYCRQLLAELVAIPSVSLHERAVAERLAQELRSFGLRPEIVPLEGESCNLICRLRGPEPGRRLIIGGHMDTVPAAEGWLTDPYRLTERDGRLYGLGAGDMKGGLAACVTVLRGIVQSKSPLKGEIIFLALADEERYSIGAHHWAAEKEKVDLAIFAEPHFDNIVTGATGKILLRLSVTGRSGHAAHPEDGVNAVDCMSRFLCAVNDAEGPLYRRGEAASYCVLHIESRYEGYSLNIPDRCEALMNKQLLTTECADTYIARLQEIFGALHCGAELKIERCIPSYPAYQLPVPFPPLEDLLAVLRQHGLVPRTQLNQSVSDGNILYSSLGIPTLLFGPKGVNFHKSNEYVDAKTLYDYCDFLREFINRWMCK